MKAKRKFLIFKEMSNGSESGAVIIFLAFALLPMILLIALAIDSARLETSHTQKRRTAHAMALAALESFQVGARAQATPNYSALVQAAITRAEQVGKLSRNSLVLGAGTNQVSLGQLRDPVTNIGTGDAGTISFGKWWFEEPVSSCAAYTLPPGGDATCPCPQSAWRGPCFEKNVDTSATGIDKVTSVRLNFYTTPTGKLSTLMSALTGSGKSELRTEATASLVPRNGIFLLDLSRSTAFQTHIPAEQQAVGSKAKSAEDAFTIDYGTAWPNGVTGWSTTAGSDSANLCVNQGIGPGSPKHCPVSPVYDSAWSIYNTFLAPKGNRSTQPPAPALTDQDHFADDYHYFNIAYTNEGGSTSQLGALVDTRFSGSYVGPQPLMTLLGGVGAAIAEVKKRSVAGDRLGLIGFDQQGNMDIRTFQPERPGENTFQDLEKLTNLTDVDSVTFRAQHMFFPRGNANTDIPEALLRASEMLSALPNFETAANYVALFSDGLSNTRHCGSCPPGTEQPILTAGNELNPDECEYPSWAPTLNFPMPTTNAEYTALTPAQQATVQTYRSIRYSIYGQSALEARAILSGTDQLSSWTPSPMTLQVLPDGFPTYVDLNIAFHMFLFGSAVGPNTVLSRNSQGTGCNSDSEARRLDVPYAGGEYSDQWDELYETSRLGLGGASNFEDVGRAGAPYKFLMPNRWYYEDGVKPTGGIWAPIRPSCPTALCSGNQLKTNLDNFCKTLNSLDGMTGYTGYSTAQSMLPGLQSTVGGVQNASLTAEYKDATHPANPEFLLMCDPSCQTEAQQVSNYIKQIYEQNPYVIVD